jgi:hypothetical protein
MIVQCDDPRWLGGCAAMAVAVALFSGQMLMLKLKPYLQIDRDFNRQDHIGVIGRQNLQWVRLFDARKLPDDLSLDLVGDASPFLYQLPMTRLNYKTVFDVDTTDKWKSIIEDWLAGMPPKAQVFIDPTELRRLADAYYDIPPLPAPATSRSSATSR